MKKSKKTKKLKTMDFILILVGVSAALFTIVMILLFIMYQTIPDTLCERFYTCVVGECGVMGVMKIFKMKYQKEDNADLSEANENLSPEGEESGVG